MIRPYPVIFDIKERGIETYFNTSLQSKLVKCYAYGMTIFRTLELPSHITERR